MVIDAHLHCSGRETVTDILQSLDEAGDDLAVLLAPFLDAPYALHDRASLRAGNDHLARLVDGHADRLVGLAVVNPALPGAVDDLDHAVQDLGLQGLRMVPSGWYPYDDCTQQCMRGPWN